MSPAITCMVCNEIQRIPTQKWKLILSDEPYVCSVECVDVWLDLEGEKENGRLFNISDLGGRLDREAKEHRDIFRSDFERRFSKWLDRKGEEWMFEAWTFPVGKGSYTPDFWIVNASIFIETKGLWRMGAKRKFRRFRDQYPNVRILVVPWIIQFEFK